MNRPLLGEESVKISVIKCVRMGAFRRKNHEVGNIHDTDTKGRDEFAQEGSSRNHFEGHFYANSDEYTYGRYLRW